VVPTDVGVMHRYSVRYYRYGEARVRYVAVIADRTELYFDSFPWAVLLLNDTPTASHTDRQTDRVQD